MDDFGFPELMKKLGIERRLITAGEHKGMLDPFSPLDAKQRQRAQALIDEIHGQFIAAVREGRGERLKEDEETFSGMVWNGERAVQLGLADALGSLDQVARDVVGAEDVIDYTPHDNVAERLANGSALHWAKAQCVPCATCPRFTEHAIRLVGRLPQPPQPRLRPKRCRHQPPPGRPGRLAGHAARGQCGGRRHRHRRLHDLGRALQQRPGLRRLRPRVGWPAAARPERQRPSAAGPAPRGLRRRADRAARLGRRHRARRRGLAGFL